METEDLIPSISRIKLDPDRRLQEVVGKLHHTIDLEKLLKDSALENVKLSDKRLKDYKIGLVKPKFNLNCGHDDYWSQRIFKENLGYDIYLDSRSGLALLYKGLPNAVICSTVESDEEDAVQIIQIQGVKAEIRKGYKIVGHKHSRGLAPLKWEELLVKLMEEISKKAGYTRILIQGSTNNGWCFGSNQFRSNVKKRYDETAEKIGYIKETDSNWYKELQ
ncbi:MAG: hypothetical protein Q8Q01_00305 [archaeon]|nr:hypothetical protein [archaeon]